MGERVLAGSVGAGPDAESVASVTLLRLRQQGVRRTVALYLVVHALAASRGHRSAGAIHADVAARAPSVALSTMWRVLAKLETCGIVHSVRVGEHAVFGLTDPPHDHLVCAQCNTVDAIPPVSRRQLAQYASRWGDVSGERAVLAVYGLCADCASATAG